MQYLKEYEILDRIAELEQYTKVKVVSYEDLLTYDTNTEFDNYKSQLAKYFTKIQTLDQFLDIDLC